MVWKDRVWCISKGAGLHWAVPTTAGTGEERDGGAADGVSVRVGKGSSVWHIAFSQWGRQRRYAEWGWVVCRSVQRGPFLSLHSCTALVMAAPTSVCGLNYGSAIFYPVSCCGTFVFSFSPLEIKWNSVSYSTIPKLGIFKHFCC